MEVIPDSSLVLPLASSLSFSEVKEHDEGNVTVAVEELEDDWDLSGGASKFLLLADSQFPKNGKNSVIKNGRACKQYYLKRLKSTFFESPFSKNIDFNF